MEHLVGLVSQYQSTSLLNSVEIREWMNGHQLIKKLRETYYGFQKTNSEMLEFIRTIFRKI